MRIRSVRTLDIVQSQRPKWLLAIVLATLLVTSACSNSPLQLESLARIAATSNPVDDSPTSTVAPPTLSTAALAKARSKLVVGIRFDAPPLASVNADGNLEGLDVDLAREFARRWLGSPDNVQFVQVSSSSAPIRLDRREVDMALGGLVHTRAAEPLVNFSVPYMNDGEALLIRTGSFGDFNSLALHNVTYIDGSSTFALRDAQVTANITVSLQSAPSYEAAIKQLRENQTDAVIGRYRRFRAVVGRDPALAILALFTHEPVAIMLPPNDSDWSSLVNITFSSLIADGTYAKMVKKWFTLPPEPIEPLPNAIDLQLAQLPDTITPRDALSRVKTAGNLHVGFNAQADPLATLDANGDAVGFEIDLCRELARRWFQNADAVTFTALTPSDIPGLLRNGSVDLAVGAIAQTQSNTRVMDFSVATYHSGQAVAVLQSAAIQDIASLSGKVVGVIQGKPDQALITSINKARGLKILTTPFPDLSSALASLRASQVDGVVDQQVTLTALARTAEDIHVLPERLSQMPIGMAMATNDTTFRAFVNLTLQNMFTDGTYARIYQKWFGSAPEGIEVWPGESTLNTALIAPTATSLPTVTPVFSVIDTPTPPPTVPPTPAPAP